MRRTDGVGVERCGGEGGEVDKRKREGGMENDGARIHGARERSETQRAQTTVETRLPRVEVEG